MKKFLPIFVLLILLSACVTSSTGGSGQSFTSAVIRGVQIHVTDSRSTVQELLGKPDVLNGNRWYYNGKTKDEPTYVLLIANDSVQNILKLDQNEAE